MQTASAVARFIYFTVTRFIGGGLLSNFILYYLQYCILCEILYFNESQRDLRKVRVFCITAMFCKYTRI